MKSGQNVNRPTRFYSNKQEKVIAKAVNGQQTPNSGATPFVKGDVVTDTWLIEAKTVTKPQKSFTIQREWIDKNKEEAFAMNKPYHALAISFGDNENFILVDLSTFIKMQIALEREEFKNESR